MEYRRGVRGFWVESESEFKIARSRILQILGSGMFLKVESFKNHWLSFSATLDDSRALIGSKTCRMVGTTGGENKMAAKFRMAD